MKILVTGGAGFISTNLIKRLIKEGHNDITSIDNYSLGFLTNHISVKKDRKKVNYRVAHVQDLDYNDYKDYDLIYHLAALSRVQPSFNVPTDTFDSNVVGTQRICEIVRNSNARMVYAGSSSRWHDPSQSPYAFTKYTGEELCKLYKNTFGSNIEIARFYNVYGPREIQDGPYATLIAKYAKLKSEGKALPIVMPGTQERNFTYIDDIVDALVLIGDKGQGDEYGIGHPEKHTVKEVAGMFNTRTKQLPPRKGNRMSASVITKKTRDLGWSPKQDLKTYINSLIDNG